jgi:uracil-DNA glycosylase
VQKRFNKFIERLAQTPAPEDSVNPFDYNDPNTTIRRNNLLLYLQQMEAKRPTVMLVAEAPGYRGMRLTGVPFSSRALIQEGIPEVGLYGEAQGYRITEDGDNKAWREQTATIVWNTLKDLRPIPLNWNSYPFHPHLPGKPLSNRKPRKRELEIGKLFLLEMIDMFGIQTVVAVGNTAEETLNTLGIPCQKVRHPAQSGKNDFVRGITELLKKLPS